jgi:hypothetical protein
MKVINGHLTQTNKKSIQAILSAGLTEGKVGKINYHLSLEDDVYTVTYKQMDRGLIPCVGSPLRLSTYIAKFKL